MDIDNIICGDNVEIMRQMPDNYIDLTVTSPPYDNLRSYNGFFFSFEEVAKELYRITKDGGVVVWIVGDATIKGSETLTSFEQAIYFKNMGFNVETMIWEKSTFSNPFPNRYHQVFEYMFIFSKGKIKTFNPIEDRKNIHGGKKSSVTVRESNGLTFPRSAKTINQYGKRYNVWKCSEVKNSKKNGHPAMFPEQLANDHIISWSNPGDLIFDPFNGSGTTCKMAKLNGRSYIGIDISQEYCDIANKRVNA